MKKKGNYRNHLILLLILLGTIILVIQALNWHSLYEEKKENTTIIVDYIKEVLIDEFHNYINDKRDVVIYFGIRGDEASREFDKKLKKIIIDYNLQEEITYIDVKPLRGENFSEELDNIYSNKELKKQKKYFQEVPALGLYRDAELVTFINGKDLTKFSIIKFLKENDVIEEVVFY